MKTDLDLADLLTDTMHAGRFKLKQLGVVAERSEVAVFVLRHHTGMIANQDGSVYSTRCSAANAFYREDQ